MSSQTSVLEITHAKLKLIKAAIMSDENKQKSKPAPRKQFIKQRETPKKAVKRSAMDTLAEPAAKRAAKTVTNHGCINVSTIKVVKKATRPIVLPKNATISATHSSINAKAVENRKSRKQSSQHKMISLVDIITKEMDEKKLFLTTALIRNVNPVVKKAVSPTTTSLAKHEAWNEADLEKFGFVFFAGYESFKFSEVKITVP